MGRGLFIKAERSTTEGWARAEPIIPNPRWQDESWLDFIKKYPTYASTEPKRIRESVLEWNWRRTALSRVLSYGNGFRDPNTEENVRLFDPVAPLRGLPDNATSETMADFEAFNHGDSDHPDPSWLLMEEVLRYDWLQEYKVWGMYAIAPEAPPQFPELPEDERWAPYGEPMRGDPWQGKVQLFVAHTGMTLTEAVGDFYTKSIPRLRSYGKPENIRIVFWYDF